MTGRIVWVASYPRSGNTWMRALLTACLQPGLSQSPLENVIVSTLGNERGFLDATLGFDTACLPDDEVQALRPIAFQQLSDRSTGRVYVKVHDQCGLVHGERPLFAPTATDCAIYVVRDPRDVCVSLAHFGSGRSLDDAVDLMLDDRRWIAPRIDGRGDPLPQFLGSWRDHVSSWLRVEDFPVHRIRFEDLLTQPQATLSALVGALGLTRSAEDVARAVDLSRFDRLADYERRVGLSEFAPGPHPFFREGRHGSWRDHLSPGQVSRITAACGTLMDELGYERAQ